MVSQYPAISHTFILGEVIGIQQAGIDVHFASINQPDRPYEKLTDEEKVACDNTVIVKPEVMSSAGAIKYAFYTLSTSPKAFSKP